MIYHDSIDLKTGKRNRDSVPASHFLSDPAIFTSSSHNSAKLITCLSFFLAASRAYDFMLTRIKSQLHQKSKREDGQSTLPTIPQGLASVNTELSEITGRFARVVGHNMAVFAPFYEDILVEIKSS